MPVAVQWRKYPDLLVHVHQALRNPGEIAGNAPVRLQYKGLAIKGDAHYLVDTIQVPDIILLAVI